MGLAALSRMRNRLSLGMSRPISRSTLRAAIAGINGAFGGKPTTVLASGYATSPEEIRDAANAILADYGHQDTMTVSVRGDAVHFEPSAD
jgi:hypothetical protein